MVRGAGGWRGGEGGGLAPPAQEGAEVRGRPPAWRGRALRGGLEVGGHGFKVLSESTVL